MIDPNMAIEVGTVIVSISSAFALAKQQAIEGKRLGRAAHKRIDDMEVRERDNSIAYAEAKARIEEQLKNLDREIARWRQDLFEHRQDLSVRIGRIDESLDGLKDEIRGLFNIARQSQKSDRN